MHKFKSIVFDFDGTLCDSYETFLKVFEKISKEFNLNSKNLEDDQMRDLGTREILKALGVGLIQLPAITKRGREEMWEHRSELKLFDGVEKVLNNLDLKKIKIAILTSNSKKIVQYVIPDSLLSKIVILKPSSLFGKKGALRSYCKDNAYQNQEVAYVGDETRDIEAARQAFVYSVALTWGYNSKNALRKVSPDLMIEKIEELNLLIREN